MGFKGCVRKMQEFPVRSEKEDMGTKITIKPLSMLEGQVCYIFHHNFLLTDPKSDGYVVDDI